MMYGNYRKHVYLVQSTTKREKGDRISPEIIKVILPVSIPTDQRSQGPATFKRIQFKKATAKMGNQQFYLIVVDCWLKSLRENESYGNSMFRKKCRSRPLTCPL